METTNQCNPNVTERARSHWMASSHVREKLQPPSRRREIAYRLCVPRGGSMFRLPMERKIDVKSRTIVLTSTGTHFFCLPRPQLRLIEVHRVNTRSGPHQNHKRYLKTCPTLIAVAVTNYEDYSLCGVLREVCTAPRKKG